MPKTSRRRVLAKPLLLSLGVIVISVVAYAAILPLFRVSTISVNSPDFVSTQQLETHVNQALIGQPIWTAWLPSFKSSLYQSFPTVSTVDPTFIDKHSLSLYLYSKLPWIGYVVNQDIRLYAEDGTWLNETETFHNEAIIDDIPIVKQETTQLLDTPSNWQAFRQNLAPIIQILTTSMPNKTIQLVQKKNGDWMFYYNDDIPVHMGDTTNFQHKIDQFNRFNDTVLSAQKKKIKNIDLRIPGKIFVEF